MLIKFKELTNRILRVKSKENIFEMPEEYMEELPPGKSNV